MSSNNINTENVISLVDMKIEDNPGDSPDSEELLIKTNSKGKLKESNQNDRPPLVKETSHASMSFNMKSGADNQFACSVTNKGKDSQKLYNELSGSVVSEHEGDVDNLSSNTSVITDTSDTNNGKTHHQNASQSLRNKRFSYNSPSTSNSHQWNNASSSNINNTAVTNPSSSSNNNTGANSTSNNSNNNNGVNNRAQFGSHLSGSFAELLNLTNNAAQALANNSNSTNNNNNNNNSEPASPSSRRGSLSSNIQQNFYRFGLSENINIETVDPTSNDSENDNRPSQVGPGETAWFLFRLYAIFKFIWSMVFSTFYFIHFVIKRSKSCDSRIYKFSIVFAAIFALQALSTLLLILYLPTSITRYTNVVRRRVVISNRAWKVTAFTFLGEIAMVIVGTILLFNKDASCSDDNNKDLAYVTITKVIVIIVICLYTMLCFPFFIIPCACTFKLLPEYKGISDKVLKRFNSILYNPTEEVDEEDAPSCSICMENYKPGTRIKRLPCNHEFHPECITQWLETNNSCPICRQTFK